jgi:hypothetical protein
MCQTDALPQDVQPCEHFQLRRVGQVQVQTYWGRGPVFKQTIKLLAASAVLAVTAMPAFAVTITMYNDSVGPASGSAANVTHYSGYLGGGGGFETPSGLLVDYNTGATTSITATLEASNVAGSLGAMPDAGTDAYNIFNGIVNLAESASYNNSGLDWYYEVTFTGLDPTKTYEFVTTANRNGSSYAGDGSSSRWTEFSILGADTYTNASSAGVTPVTPDVLKMNTGYNTILGYVVAWSGITAADGSFTILSQNVGAAGPGELIKSYGLQGFRLTQSDSGPSATVPLPATLPLFGTAVAFLGIRGRRKRRRA